MSVSLLIVIGSALVGLGVIGIGVGVVVYLLIRKNRENKDSGDIA